MKKTVLSFKVMRLVRETVQEIRNYNGCDKNNIIDTHKARQGLRREETNLRGAGSTGKRSVKVSRRSNSCGLNFILRNKQKPQRLKEYLSEFLVSSNINGH